MKNIYKALMALSAAFLLVPAAHAQTSDPEAYVNYPTKGVGVNKYLKTTEPNEDGEYTLRLETFTTGTTTKYAIPTDFVLVLDCSGSMHYDCLFGKQRPESLSKADNEDPNNDYYDFLIPAHTSANIWDGVCHYTYSYGYKTGTVGTDMGTSQTLANGRTSSSHFNAKTGDQTNTVPSLYYFYDPDQTFYLIHRENASSHYRLYITTASAGKLYLRSTNNTTMTLTPAANVTTSYDGTWNSNANKILLIGYSGDKIYRPLMRREPLIKGVDRFIDSILTHNQEDNFDPAVTKKHQVSIVAFGSGYTSGDSGSKENPSITPSTDVYSGSRVVKGFAEITTTTASQYKSALDTYFGFRGYTFIFYGVRLAKRLLQTNQSGNMSPVNEYGGTNRNKVVVVFTDGEPSMLNNDGTVPSKQETTSTTSAFFNVKFSLADAKIIKADYSTGTGYSKGTSAKIFTIDLSGSANAARFLKHLSSDYPDGAATSGTTLGTITYTGTEIDDPMYYMDANAGGLEEAFLSIVDASTGNTSEHMVAVDVVSDSFDLPEGLASSDKVKLYTAQCVGVKTINGTEYMAFTDDIPVGSRDALDEMWFNSINEETHEVVWTKQENLDIDSDISCVINEETKQLVIKGFDFANLWCGKDTDHTNTRQIEEGMANYDNQADGYRGFKLVAEFPIVVAEDAVGGPDVPTNKFDISGLFNADAEGTPTGTAIVTYPKPALTIPVRLTIEKSGLLPGESASFTLQRRLAQTGTTYEDFTTFVLTGVAGDDNPFVRFVNLDPRYYYRVKENGWSWAYENAAQDVDTCPTTEDPNLGNPIVIENTHKTDIPLHAEAKAVNKMKATGSTTTTVYDLTQ